VYPDGLATSALLRHVADTGARRQRVGTTRDVVRMAVGAELWMDSRGNMHEMGLADTVAAGGLAFSAGHFNGIGTASGGNARGIYPEFKAGWMGGRCMRFPKPLSGTSDRPARLMRRPSFVPPDRPARRAAGAAPTSKPTRKRFRRSAGASLRLHSNRDAETSVH